MVTKKEKCADPNADAEAKTFEHAAYLSRQTFEEAAELRALFGYKKPSMIAANKTRALSSIDIIAENLEEIKKYIEAQQS